MSLDSLLDSALLRALVQGLAIIAALFVAVAVLEKLFGGDLRRYRSRAFATDLAYAVIYLGGLYSFFISAPVLALIALAIPASWQLDLLGALPTALAFFVYWILADAIQYWLHRWEHSSAILWRLHSLHHSQTSLTFATSWRNHPLEQLFINVLTFVPLMIVGMPKWFWLPVILLQYLFEALQHADLNWRYGRLYPVVVSPVFHAIHHAPERSRHDTNYGKILAVWDGLFGTLTRGERPERYGIAGGVMPVTLAETLAFPFRQSARGEAAPPVDTAAARQAPN